MWCLEVIKHMNKPTNPDTEEKKDEDRPKDDTKSSESKDS